MSEFKQICKGCGCEVEESDQVIFDQLAGVCWECSIYGEDR